ncbi:malate dehydrogenase [Blattella germanica]|nr:malate dehydrogenase [Blattella germanica]
MSSPLRVVITGAAGQIAYSLLYQIAKGDVFGADQPLILHLLDIEPMMGVLGGVVMEIMDCALPLVKEVIPTADPAVAFKDVEAAFLVGAMPRREEENVATEEENNVNREWESIRDTIKLSASESVGLLKKRQSRKWFDDECADMGEALDKHAKKTVKVLVVGNPANTNALICSKYAPSIPRENFSAMTRLDQNRGRAQIANRLNVGVGQVKNVIIWGNHSATQVPDANSATVDLGSGPVPVPEALKDNEWLKGQFITEVRWPGEGKENVATEEENNVNREWESIRDTIKLSASESVGLLKKRQSRKWFDDECADMGLTVPDYAKPLLEATGKELLEEKTEAEAVCEH